MPRVAAAKRSTSASKRSYAKRTAPVRRRQLTGKGDYKFSKKQAPSVGARIGAYIGDKAQDVFKHLTGLGDYKVTHNVLLEETNDPPMIVNRGKEFVIRHREYVQDVYSAAGTASTPSPFALESFSIQPGISDTFPWLSSVADNFEQYRIEGIVFEFKSLYSDAVVTQNGSIGSMVLATEYNASAPSFLNKQQMENYEFAQSCKPSLSVIHPIECARMQSPLTELYIRVGGLAANQDIKTYDFGNFQIASQGIPLGTAGAAVNLGELWVSYQIVLIKPKLPSTLGTNEYSYSHYKSIAGAAAQFTSTNPLGVAPYSAQTGTTFPLLITPASRTISIPMSNSDAIRYCVNMRWASTISPFAAWMAPTFATDPNITVNTYLACPFPTAVNGTGNLIFMDITVNAVSNPLVTNAVITINTGGGFENAGIITSDIWFSEKPLVA